MQKNRLKFTVQKKIKKNAKLVLFKGDARNFLDTLEPNSISLVVSSPPYNIGKEYESKEKLSNYIAFHSRIIAKLHYLLKNNGSICWQVGNYLEDGEIIPLDIIFYNIFKMFGFKLKNRIIWHYRHGLHSKKKFSGRYETILWFTKTDRYIFNLDSVRVKSKYPGKYFYKGEKKGQLSGNPKGKNPSDVWEIISNDWESCFWDIPNVKANHPEKTEQPCQFPIELVERCVLALTKENDIILDPFAGVGSTLIAAIKNGRKAYGSEKENFYYKIALQRLQKLKSGTLEIRPLGKPVHEPNGKEKVSQVPRKWQRSKKTIYYTPN